MKKHIIGLLLTAASLFFGGAAAHAESAMETLQSLGTLEVVYEQDFNEPGSENDGVFPAVGDSFVDNLGRGRTFNLHMTGSAETEISIQVPSTGGMAVLKYSVMFGDNSLHRKPLTIMRDTSAAGNENIFLMADMAGNINQYNTGKPLMGYETDAWYDLTYVFDFNKHKYDLYINDNLLVEDTALPNPALSAVARIWLVKIWDRGSEGDVYIDDIGVYAFKPFPAAELGESDFSYDTDSIRIDFTTAMDEETLSGEVTLSDSAGTSVEFVGALSDDGLYYILAPKEVLYPGETYSINISDFARDENGDSLLSSSMEFTTENAAFTEVLFRCGTDITELAPAYGKNLNVYAFSESEKEIEALLVAGLYNGKKLVKVASRSMLLEKGERINTSIAIPADGENYSVRAFLWNNTDGQSAYMADTVIK